MYAYIHVCMHIYTCVCIHICLVGTSTYYFTVTLHLTSLKANETALSVYYYLSYDCDKLLTKASK